MTLWGIIGTIIAIVIGYLIGSFNWSIFISKLFYKVDIRKYYSGNAGATNASRIFGVKVGLLIVFLDGFKLFIAAGFCMLISYIHNGSGVSFSSTSYFLPLFFVCFGHSYPIYYKFKGGKVVSCFFALTILTNPYYFLLAAALWWIIFLIFRYISLSSICAALILLIFCWIPQLSGIDTISTDNYIFADNKLLWLNYCHTLVNPHPLYLDNIVTINIVIDASAILLILRHKQNIIRLIKKTEPKYQIKKSPIKK